MNSQVSTERFFMTADGFLQQGTPPTVELMAATLGIEDDTVAELLAQWWEDLADRMQTVMPAIPVPDVPDSLSKSFQSIWLQAIQEAHTALMHDKAHQQLASEEARKHSESALKRAHDEHAELENNFRDLRLRVEDEQSHAQALEAEISVLKINLATATSELKAEEQRRLNIEQEAALLQKTFDDSKRTFDQRVKVEQRHSLELVSKAEADTRYYRHTLEKMRDESGRKESALTKEIHNLQGLLAKKDVKLDTYQNQIKALDDELKRYKGDTTQSGREITKITGLLLSEQNKNKRLEDKVKEQKDELKLNSQRQLAAASEVARRDSILRGQLKEKDEELMRTKSRFATLEKRIAGQEEEIRRLKARL